MSGNNGLDDLFLSEKVRELETRHIRLESLIEHLTDSIDEIKHSIKEALDLKSKVDNHSDQLRTMWERIDSQKRDLIGIDKKVEGLILSYNACQERQKEERQWRSARAGSLADKLIWIAIATVGFGAAIMAIKGFIR